MESFEAINKYTVLRAHFLSDCPKQHGEPCGGDMSVGIQPCAYYQDADIDENENALPSGCLLEMEMEGEPAPLIEPDGSRANTDRHPEWYTIAVDFDGTLCENKYPDVGEPRPLMIDYIRREAERGARIVLHTCRENGTVRRLLDEALEFCEAHGIKLYAVNENPAQEYFVKLYGTTPARKVYANLYIDDKGVNAEEIIKLMERERKEELSL